MKRKALYDLVNEERDRQDAKWGIQDNPLVNDITKNRLKEKLEIIKSDNDTYQKNDMIDWHDIAYEEFLEFFTADDGSENQKEELVQIIAVLVEIYDYYIIKGK